MVGGGGYNAANAAKLYCLVTAELISPIASLSSASTNSSAPDHRALSESLLPFPPSHQGPVASSLPPDRDPLLPSILASNQIPLHRFSPAYKNQPFLYLPTLSLRNSNSSEDIESILFFGKDLLDKLRNVRLDLPSPQLAQKETVEEVEKKPPKSIEGEADDIEPPRKKLKTESGSVPTPSDSSIFDFKS